MTSEHIPFEGPERRRSERLAASHAITVREAGRNTLPAQLTSLTPHGCGVAGVSLSGRVRAVWIRLPGLESQLAQCCWTETGAAGFEFDHALHPAVAERLAHAQPEVVPLRLRAAPLTLVHDADRPATRREQIMQGEGQVPEQLLSKKPAKESNAELMSMVRRRMARVVDQRLERRFMPPPEALMGFRAGGQPATIHDLSASGIKLAAELAGSIGAEVPVAFAGFPPLTGSIVWKRHGQTGVRLPDHALDLFEAA
jgi:hypothetical protein